MKDSLIRQEHLYRLASFCAALEQTLERTGAEPEQTAAIWRASISAECVRCGIQVSGEELYALSQPPCPERATAKIGRMRLGDCARQGCDGYFYRLSFADYPGLDWTLVLSEIENVRPERASPVRSGKWWGLFWQRLAHARLPLRLGLALTIVVVFLLVRQWHQGGRIPFFREPENFHVDPAPEGELAH